MPERLKEAAGTFQTTIALGLVRVFVPRARFSKVPKLFGWHNSLCIFKTKVFHVTKPCSYFNFYCLYNIWKDQLYRTSGSEFYELLFGSFEKRTPGVGGDRLASHSARIFRDTPATVALCSGLSDTPCSNVICGSGLEIFSWFAVTIHFAIRGELKFCWGQTFAIHCSSGRTSIEQETSLWFYSCDIDVAFQLCVKISQQFSQVYQSNYFNCFYLDWGKLIHLIPKCVHAN